MGDGQGRKQGLADASTYRSPARVPSSTPPPPLPTPAPIVADEAPSGTSRAKWMALLFLGLALAATIPFIRSAMRSQSVMTYRSAHAIEPHIATLLPSAVHVTESKVREKYVKGRIAVIDVDNATIDPSFHHLPLELLPKDAADIGSVGWVSCKRTPATGMSVAGVPIHGQIERCSVQIVDWSLAKIVARGDFESAIVGTAEIPSRPSPLISLWISSLDRR